MQYDDECDELLWVKAGEPGEKPTIIRQVRSENSSGSSRDNSDNSTSSSTDTRRMFMVDSGNRPCGLTQAIEEKTCTSDPESRVIVVNVSEQVYPAVIDNHRIQKWKDLHTHAPVTANQPTTTAYNDTNLIVGKHTNMCPNDRITTTVISHLSHKSRTTSQLSPPKHKLHEESPHMTRCASAEPKLSSPYVTEKLIKSRDEGYTSLSEDCKDSDCESVRSKSLPSSWKASHINKNGSEISLHKFAQKIVSNNNGQALTNGHCSQNNYTDEITINAQRKLEKKNFRHNIENTIETCTCLFCLRSAIYHAQDEDDSDSLVDHPCSCNEPSIKCGGRWAVISLLVCFFPLLLCYPPLKGCLNIHDAWTKRKKLKKDKLLKRSKQMNCQKAVL